MRWLFRPSMLVLLSVVLAVGAAALVLWSPPPEIRAVPLARQRVGNRLALPGDQRVDVGALRHRGQQGGRAGWPPTTPALRSASTTPPSRGTPPPHPELAVTVRGGSQRLLFRWYKLTSDQKTRQWVAALLDGSRRPPLAIIGGNSSDQAKEIALALKNEVAAPRAGHGAAAAADGGDRRPRPGAATSPTPAAVESARRPHLPLLLHQPADGRGRHPLRQRPGRAAPRRGAALRRHVERRRLLEGPHGPLLHGVAGLLAGALGRRRCPFPKPSTTAWAASTSPTAGRRRRSSG